MPTTITIPEGAGAKTTSVVAASSLHVETSEIQEVVNVMQYILPLNLHVIQSNINLPVLVLGNLPQLLCK